MSKAYEQINGKRLQDNGYTHVKIAGALRPITSAMKDTMFKAGGVVGFEERSRRFC